MTPRQRFIETLTFGNPDRIPFRPGGPRESTRAKWRTQGLPEGVDWKDYLCEQLGIEPDTEGASGDPGVKPVGLNVDFRMIPQFEEKILEHRDGHYVVQDWKGNVCEISDQYDTRHLRQAIDFVTRRWIRCPVENRDDWQQMKQRYDLDAPGRFPDDFADRAARSHTTQYPVGLSWSGPFWQMREWCGFEGLCMLMVEQPELVDEMAEFWCEFMDRVLERILAAGKVDEVIVNEDMAYKKFAMISPAMVRRFCMPSWKRWFDRLSAAGVPVLCIDSDGFIGELVPLWMEAGCNATIPMEVAAGNDINEFRDRFGRRMAYLGGVDKRAMAAGGKVLADEMKRVAPVVRDGGYIPGCDHGVPPDVSWPNFVDYSRQLAQMTGWL